MADDEVAGGSLGKAGVVGRIGRGEVTRTKRVRDAVGSENGYNNDFGTDRSVGAGVFIPTMSG